MGADTTTAPATAARHTDLIAHFRSVVRAKSDKRAVMHLVRGEQEGTTLTYSQLDRRARSMAAYLQQRRAQGARALMLFEAGVEWIYTFLGCVYARVIAVPMPAPVEGNVVRQLKRLKNVVVDADMHFVLTTAAIAKKLRDVASRTEGLERLEWVLVDELPDASAQWLEEPVRESDVVYLQYTSGSTAAPKGVMVTHRNLVTSIASIDVISRYTTEGTQAISWLPYFHDMGLIEGVLHPLAHGVPVYVMSPVDFVTKPVRWLNAIHRYRASHTAGPNFALELCARKTTAEERRRLDLSCWRKAMIGAEPIRSATLDRFLEAFVPHGFRPRTLMPAYGLAEATLVVTASDCGAQYFRMDAAELERNRVRAASEGRQSRTMVGCGRVGPGFDVRVVNPTTFELAKPAEVGEIWVSGDMVARGYWNRPQESEATFKAQVSGLPQKTYLRTGDLGFIDAGEVVVTGRYKDLIILDGRNHYPQEIEKTAEASHPALRAGCCIAFAVESDESPRVVLVCELNKGYALDARAPEDGPEAVVVSSQDLQRCIRRDVAAEHQVRLHDIVFLAPGTIAKTTSGKLQRGGCKRQYVDGTLVGVLPCAWRMGRFTPTAGAESEVLNLPTGAGRPKLERQT